MRTIADSPSVRLVATGPETVIPTLAASGSTKAQLNAGAASAGSTNSRRANRSRSLIALLSLAG